MKTFAWLAAGGILMFAVSGHPAFFNLRLAGLILIARGAAELWFSIGSDGRTHYTKRLKSAIAWSTETFEEVTAELARDDGSRVPLAELFARPGGRDRDSGSKTAAHRPA